MTPRIEKTIFISYRRTNLPWALAIYQELTHNGYDVFFDYLSIPSGDFENIIVENIKARAHFVVILTPSALERCNEPGDWLRREIETAMDEKRNIIPLMLESFDFGSPSTVKALTGKLEKLKKYNGLRLHSEYFFEGMDRLRKQYLNVSLDTVIHPVSEEAKPITKEHQAAASEASPVEKEQLTAQEWFERGYSYQEADNWKESIRCYTQAINLEPNFAVAFRNRGDCFQSEGVLAKAIEDYNKSIRLYSAQSISVKKRGRALVGTRKPKTRYSYDFLEKIADNLRAYSELNLELAKAYFGRGIAHQLTNKLKKALKDYDKAIQYYPYFYGYYYMRGRAHREDNNLKGAIADLQEALRLNSDSAEAYYDSACIESILGNSSKALKFIKIAIEKESEYKEKARHDSDFENIRNTTRFKELVGE
jgi:tetratricopeptide (TPR) repeat protein